MLTREKLHNPLTGHAVRGGERIRTADLCVANAALYQLSYAPEGTCILPSPLPVPTSRRTMTALNGASVRALAVRADAGSD